LTIENIFSSISTSNVVSSTVAGGKPAASIPTSEKAPVIIKKKKDEIGTPSIMQALSGNYNGEQLAKDVIPEQYARNTRDSDHDFSEEQLLTIWPEYTEKYVDQVHLYNTLLVKPQLLDNYKVKITVENSVQQDQIRLLKPEIIGFLQRRLRNSKIDVKIELIEATFEDKLLTDEQKLAAMMKKNPVLQKMKSMFNLDFNG
jgi:hypothetical protein